MYTRFIKQNHNDLQVILSTLLNSLFSLHILTLTLSLSSSLTLNLFLFMVAITFFISDIYCLKTLQKLKLALAKHKNILLFASEKIWSDIICNFTDTPKNKI